MGSLTLLAKYADIDGKTRFYDAADAMPMDGVVRKDCREAVVDDEGRMSSPSVFHREGRVYSVDTVQITDGLITAYRRVINPDKLTHI